MITTIVICIKWCLTWYSIKKICYRRYRCSISSLFDTRLFVCASENIHICICIRRCSYSNPNKIMKSNMVLNNKKSVTYVLALRPDGSSVRRVN
jgi:hypothetical protein